MIEAFTGEDLMMMLLPELKVREEYDLPYTRVNSWRIKLQDNDIPYDLGANDLETLFFEYPENIKLKYTEIIVKKTPRFIERIELRIEYYNKSDLELLNKLWDEL